MSTPPQFQEVEVTTARVGNAKDPTFLERWGVVFVAWVGGWILLVGSGMLVYFLLHQPVQPNLAGLSVDQIQGALSSHKQLLDQWRDSLTFIFDLLVTKTALPILTLLLGYLFGKRM